MKTILFTATGYKNLLLEIDSLTEKRPEILSSLIRAREMGDLSENGAYKSAKYELTQLDREIRHLKQLMLKAQIVEPKSNDYVQLGHTVTLKKEIRA